VESSHKRNLRYGQYHGEYHTRVEQARVTAKHRVCHGRAVGLFACRVDVCVVVMLRLEKTVVLKRVFMVVLKGTLMFVLTCVFMVVLSVTYEMCVYVRVDVCVHGRVEMCAFTVVMQALEQRS
jgi:hypothetical protein